MPPTKTDLEKLDALHAASTRMSEIDRFMSKVIPEPNSGCWLWIGASGGDGDYGRFYKLPNLVPVRAHRWIMEYMGDAIPHGIMVCHKCDTPSCVNPKHLFLGTHKDNMADRNSKGRASGPSKTQPYCKRGHEFTPDNISLHKGVRTCKICRKASSRASSLRYQERQRIKKINLKREEG